MKLEIHRATESDKYSLKAHYERYELELDQYDDDSTGSLSLAYYDLYWIEAGRYPFIAFLGGELAGFCFLRETETEFSISEFAILPNFRKKGHGRQLVNFIVQFCTSQNSHSLISAYSLVNNTGARKFWNSCGFKTVGTIESDRKLFHNNVLDLDAFH